MSTLRTAHKARIAMSLPQSCLLTVTLLLSAPLMAQAQSGEAGAADLPPLPMAQQAIPEYAAVETARQMQRAQKAGSEALRVGPYEYTLRLEGAQRQDRTVGQRFNDLGAVLERPLRLPQKARLDEALGQQGVDMAGVALGDALHESARQLLRLWFGWMRTAATQTIWQGQVDTLKEQLRVTVQRGRAGDVPRQEVLLAEASLAQAEFASLQAASRSAGALIELQRSYPSLQVPARPVVLEPGPVTPDATYWSEAVLSHNHELRLAQAEVRRRSLMAERLQTDMSPDPTVGLRYSSERNSGDRILGLFVSVPLSGDARRARTAEALSLVDVARSQEQAVARRLGTEVMSLYSAARAARDAALKADTAARGLRRSAEMASLGYSLGEGTLSDVLLARRLALDADLAATLARLEASELRYRLLLDAHQLWDFD